MKKTISIILCLVMIFALVACGQKSEDGTTTNPGDSIDLDKINTGGGVTADNPAVEVTPPPAEAKYEENLSMYIGDKVALVDPTNKSSGGSQSGIIYHMMFDTLYYLDIENNYVPMLATEYTANDTGDVWTLKLREGVKFHNGEPFVADDVIFTVEASHEAAGTALYNAFNQVTEITANGDYEVTMKLAAPNFDFLADIGGPLATILNRDAYENGKVPSGMEAGWVGTGPFVLTSMVPNDSLHFEAFEDYWNPDDMAKCKTFDMRYIAEATARQLMLENGEFTFANVDGNIVQQVADDPRFVVNGYVMTNCNNLTFNMRDNKPVTSDKNFRWAVAYAIDPQAGVDIALSGGGQVANSMAIWGSTTMYKNPNLPRIEQDLEKAKEYLAASCYNGEDIELGAGMAQTIKAAQVFQEQLTAIGITCHVHEYDGPSFTAATQWDNNDIDIIVSSSVWTVVANSGAKLFEVGNRSNGAHYINQEVIDLWAKAAATPDGPERQEMYYRIQEIVADDLPYLPTWHMMLFIGAQKGTGGTIFFPTNYHDYSGAYYIKPEA